MLSNSKNQLFCMAHGGLVSTYSWMKNGVLIYQSDFKEIQIINKTTVTSKLVLDVNNTYLNGIFQCCVVDGNGRNSSNCIQINGIIPN